MKQEKLFIAEYTKEALKQFSELDIDNQDKILSAIKSFEILGIKYKNINDLGNELFEIKPKGVRAYFKVLNIVNQTTKYSLQGFLYRVLFKGLNMYVEANN